MKALITAGGRATRLRPITTTINKHLIPLANKPMLFNALEKITEAGITEIGINVNPGESEIQAVLGDGSRWGARITYLEQTGGPLGLAHIVKNARPFLGNEPFLFYLGDNIILGSIAGFVRQFQEEKPNALLALSKVRDPQRFGVPVIEDGRIVRVEEKPTDPKSDFAVTGIYLYDASIFDACEAIPPSARGEYEISDAHTWLVENGRTVGYREITGWWKDTGKPADLLEGNQLLLAEMKPEEATTEGATIDSSATIHGKVRIGKGTVIGPGVLIRGPVAIGERCTVTASYIGPSTAIGNDAVIADTEIEHSVVFDGVRIVGIKRRLVDCLIGRNAQIVSAETSLPRGHQLLVGDNSLVQV
jgi:glucose-1-phosphate thymidylyltransferase